MVNEAIKIVEQLQKNMYSAQTVHELCAKGESEWGKGLVAGKIEAYSIVIQKLKTALKSQKTSQ